jgi:hypothetical protein
MRDALGRHLITDCLPRARLVDEYKSIYAIVLFVGNKGQVISLGSVKGVADLIVPLTGRKVLALKALIEEGYRFEITGRFPFFGQEH